MLNLFIDESGWAWFIPLSEGLVSVGVVRHQSAYSKSALPDGHIPQSSKPSETTPLTAPQNSSSHNQSTNSLSGTTPLSTLRSSRMIHSLQPNNVISRV